MTRSTTDDSVFHGLDTDGKRIHEKALPYDEAALRELYTCLAGHGPVLVIHVAYLPMRRIADLHPGNAKTDARDARRRLLTVTKPPHDTPTSGSSMASQPHNRRRCPAHDRPSSACPASPKESAP